MAIAYWHADSGNWSDAGNWFAATDGGGGAFGSAPGVGDTARFDANSFDNNNQTVTIDANSSCLDMTWTGATNTPTVAFSTNRLSAYGAVTFIAAMVTSGGDASGDGLYFRGAGATSLTTNGLTLSNRVVVSDTHTCTLQDELTCNSVFHAGATLDTNGQTVNCGEFSPSGVDARTLTMGASVINCTEWDAEVVTNLTITANTATINVTGTGAVTLGAADYDGADFNLNGTAHTVTGEGTGIVHFTRTGTAAACTVTFNSNLIVDGTLTLNGNAVGNRLTVGGTAATLTCLSFAGNHVDFSTPVTLILTNAGAGATTFAGNGQTYPHTRVEGAGAYTLTITGDNTFEKYRPDCTEAVKTTLLTPTSTQTIRNLQVFSSAANVAVFQTGGAAATIKGHRGYCELNHVSLTAIVATEKYRYYAGDNSTDGTGNTNWIFTRKVRPGWIGRVW